MNNENISNKKYIIMSILFISMLSICAFLIGYGINDGTCPKCNDKTVVKVFTTVNNIETTVDYNMVTSEIKKDLIGKYINDADKKSFFEIQSDGNFKLVINNCSEYVEYTNDNFVLLLYYRKELSSSSDELIENENYDYYTTLTLIPKGEIEGDLLTAKMLTFSDSVYSKDGISKEFIGPNSCSSSNLYQKEVYDEK